VKAEKASPSIKAGKHPPGQQTTMNQKENSTMRNNWKSIIKSLALGASLLVIAGMALTLGRASVAGKAKKTPCTVANIAGDYGFLATGDIYPNPYGFPTGDVAAVGVISFDGQGNYTVSDESVSFNGQVVHNFTDVGTYTVTPDCVCKTSGGLGTTHSVFVNDRREALSLKTDANTTVSFVFKRIE
jgi:hypothetical protein